MASRILSAVPRLSRSPASPPAALPAAPAAVLREGATCWKSRPATRAALLIDGAAYFAALRRAFENARHSIVILGWDIRADLVLEPDSSQEPLRDLLDRLVRQRPSLEVRILIWDWLLLYSLDRQPLPWWHLGVRTHERVRFVLDSCHPPAGCLHEKLAVIDGCLAFVGGIDLTAGRWDTPAHRVVEPHRAPAGERRPPFHDYMLMVEGPVAGGVEQLALHRWQRATGEVVQPTPWAEDQVTPWPDTVAAGFEGIEVAIARTRPAWRGESQVREIESLYLAAIAKARTSIYIENQYLTVERIARALAIRLAEPEGPEVLIVTPKACEGVFETAVMDVGRSGYLRRLRRAAASPDRLRIMILEVQDGDAKAFINVHGKLLIVDDSFICLGSANLANRSMGLDTECNLAIEAKDEPTREGIRLAKARLLAEHLELDVEQVQQGLRQAGGKAIALIQAIGPGRMRELRLRLSPLVREFASPARLADLDEALTSNHIALHLAPPTRRRRLSNLFTRIGLVLALVMAAAVVLGTEIVVGREWVEWGLGLAERHAVSPLGGAAVLLTFILGSQLLIPVTLMIALTAAATGPWLGFTYAMLGSCAAAAVTFLIGRGLGRRRVRRLAGRRLASISKRLGQHGIVATSLIRLVPMAPFSLVNLVAGVSEIRLRDFLAGSAIGLFPGVALMTLFGDRLGQWLRQPDPWDLVALLAGLLLLLLLTIVLHRWSARTAAP